MRAGGEGWHLFQASIPLAWSPPSATAGFGASRTAPRVSGAGWLARLSRQSYPLSSSDALICLDVACAGSARPRGRAVPGADLCPVCPSRPRASLASHGQSACRMRVVAGRVAIDPQATGGNESGVRTFVGQQQPAARIEAKLDLGVGDQNCPAGRRWPAPPPVHLQGDPPPAPAATPAAHQRRPRWTAGCSRRAARRGALVAGVKNRLGQPGPVGEPGRQRHPAHGTRTSGYSRNPDPARYPPGHALDGHHRQPAAGHGPARELGPGSPRRRDDSGPGRRAARTTTVTAGSGSSLLSGIGVGSTWS